MLRFCYWLLLCLPVAVFFGCAEEPKRSPVAVPPQSETAASGTTEIPADSSKPTVDEPAEAAKEKPEEPAGPTELKLETISFMVPGSWKKAKPANNIVEAEFELPRAAADEYDGRLTLMSAGGNPEETIATRTSEFDRDADDPPKRETVKIGSVEATWVDLRGTWRGSSFQPMNPPRSGYRMLLVIIPFSERSAFYAKLVGPRETIAAREEEFREFIKSARLKPR